MYVLSNEFATRYKYEITIVGCGGTGGFVAEGLCRILPEKVPLVLIDPDHVEERNLNRQNFFRDELGMPKSEALAKRLSKGYSRPVSYSQLPVSFTQISQFSIVIGCVDNGPARRDIANKFKNYDSPPWWIDAGNGENFGQILIGNSPTKSYESENDKEKVFKIPLPTLQMPELLRQTRPLISCTENNQGPTINQTMAALAIEVVRRLIDGKCPWVQLYLDMNNGILQPVFATPEILEDMIKHKIKKGG